MALPLILYISIYYLSLLPFPTTEMNIGFSLNDTVDAGVGQTPPHLVMLTLRFIVQITTIRNQFTRYI